MSATTATIASPKRRRRRIVPGELVVGIAALLLLLAVVLAPVIAQFDPTQIVGPARHAPDGTHWLGTDHLGRDVFSRMLFGGRQTLLIAIASTGIAAILGIPIGLLAGYFGKWQAAVSMRLMDVLLAFPGLLLALIVVTIAGVGVGTTILAVGISFIPVIARVVYGSTQRVRAEEYVAAAQVVGASPWRIIGGHVLPVVAPEIVVLLSSAIGWTTLLAAALNFLGFGVMPPTPEWGADLGGGVKYLAQAWWISAAPGLGISATILIANFLGDYLAQRFGAQPVVAGSAAPTSSPS